MSAVIHYILNLGSAVFVPFIMIIIGLIMKMKPKKAIVAGLTLGIAFTGMNIVLTFMLNSVNPAASAFVQNTGIKLNAIDIGWPATAAISWAWPYGLIMFPLQIAINAVMLIFGWTDCLNVDLWNVWNKIFTGTVVVFITGSLPLAFVAAAIEIIFELKNADITQKACYDLTKIPGVACPHSLLIQAAIMAPLNRLMDFIPGLNKLQLNSDQLKAKIGVFGENSIVGFIVGALIAIFGGMNVKDILNTAVEVATALVLFPMVSKLFMQALAPISDATGKIMKEKFKGREIYIGLDWPFLAGRSEIWVTGILLVPIELLMAVGMSKMGLNNVLPLAGLINIVIVVPALVVTGGNLVRMIILGILVTPLYLAVDTSFAPMLTNLAKGVSSIKLSAGQQMAYFSCECPGFRWALVHALNVVHGEFVGIIVFALYVAVFVWYAKYMKKKDIEREAAEN